jgi:hypothetical protein
MTVIRNTAVLRCTPEQAFDYLSDHRTELEWNPRCEVMDKLTEGPVGQGTRYRAKWKSAPFVEVVTVRFDRPHTWTHHNGGSIEVTVTCRLEPVSEGTRFHIEFEPRPHGWFRVVFPVFLLVIRRQERANMTDLRDALERHLQAQLRE